MKYFVLFTLISALTLPLVSQAQNLNPRTERCIENYTALIKETWGDQALQWGGSGMTLGGTTAGAMGVVTPMVASGFVLGGSTAQSYGGSLESRVEFANKMGLAILEAQANAVGPITAEMALSLSNDLSSRVNKSESSVSISFNIFSTNLSDDDAIQMYLSLKRRSISGEELLAVHRKMIATGSICSLDGTALDSEAWAKMVVSDVSSRR